MNIIWLQITSLIYIVFLNIVYFSKNRLSTLENNIYKRLLVLNVLGLIIELCCFYSVAHMDTVPIFNMIVTKLLLVYYFGFIILYTYYVFIVAHNSDEQNSKKLNLFLNKVKTICYLVFIINSLVICSLPLYYHSDPKYVYSYGPAVKYLVVSLVLVISVWLIELFKYYKNIKVKKYLPIIIFIVLAGIAGVIQSMYPHMLLTTPIETFIIFLMYFTIENPDMRMVDELLDNRKIIERASEEKSVFFFKMSQGLKEPVNNIDKEINLYKEKNFNNSEALEIIDNISQNNKKIGYLINEVIGIDSFNTNNINKAQSTYNIYSLLESIKTKYKNANKEGVNYKFEVAQNIPREMYGDGIKLKQILSCLLAKSLENTNKGFVLFDVNSFTRHDICRLVISIKDSGTKINVKEINNILNESIEISEQDEIKIEKNDIDLGIAYKLIKSLGGTMYIKDSDTNGIEITITIDQYIVLNDEIKTNSKVETYIKGRTNTKKILLVDDDEEETGRIRNILERRGYDVSISMYGQDAIDRIKDKEKYDVIIIDDEMSLMNGINVLYELNKLQNKSKKIVLLGKDKLFIAKHYLKDGFDDFISKENLNNDLGKI